MQAGEIVEKRARPPTVFDAPQHPYTARAATPSTRARRSLEMYGA